MSPAIAIDAVQLERLYERDAEDYCRSLPLEHFMESIEQSTQRKITVESLDVVSAQWPEFQVFSEILIQYTLSDDDLLRPVRVVPDNFVIVHSEPLKVRGSFMMPLQPVGPFLVLEYVSTGNQRKDYVDNMLKYEQDLKVPYYLLFFGEKQTLEVFHLVDEKYEPVEPNAEGRLAIPELDLEVAILDEWTRYWFRGVLLPLPGDLFHALNATQAELKKEKKARRAEEKARLQSDAKLTEAEAEIAMLREQLAKRQP